MVKKIPTEFSVGLTKEQYKKIQEMAILKFLGGYPKDIGMGETLEQYMKRKIRHELLHVKKFVDHDRYPVMPTKEQNEAFKREVDRIFHERIYGKSLLVDQLNELTSKKNTTEVKIKNGMNGTQKANTGVPLSAHAADAQKKGFHTRFQQIDEGTIQEKDEAGHIRVFYKNKDGVWETENPDGRTVLQILGKNLFGVDTYYPGGSHEAILYAPARKIREFFTPNQKGVMYLAERMEEDTLGWRNRQIFDEDGSLLEEKVSKDWALKKLVSRGRVLFDCTKPVSDHLTKAVQRKMGKNR